MLFFFAIATFKNHDTMCLNMHKFFFVWANENKLLCFMMPQYNASLVILLGDCFFLCLFFLLPSFYAKIMKFTNIVVAGYIILFLLLLFDSIRFTPFSLWLDYKFLQLYHFIIDSYLNYSYIKNYVLKGLKI